MSLAKLTPKRRASSTQASPAVAAPEGSASSPAQVFRRLVFGGSVSVCVSLASAELPRNADGTVESYYIQAPRISYLPLLLAQVRSHLLELALDEGTAASISNDQLWFEYQGAPLRWHWPIGLLFDYHTSQPSISTALASPNTTLRPSASSRAGSSSSPSPTPAVPFRITLHLKDPPSDNLLMTPSLETCRGGFMNRLKESDFVRWGSVKRVTNLRKEQQDALWEGVVQNDYDKFWTVASKLFPLPSPVTTSSPATLSPAPSQERAPSPSSNDGRMPDGNGVRNVPIRIHLPSGAPVMQDLTPPVVEGRPVTLLDCLYKALPVLFPLTASPLATVIVQGVYVPLETHVGWLGACLAGPDGWVAVVVVLPR